MEGGYIIDGVWDYCSGIPYSSHFIGGARVLNGKNPPDIGQCRHAKDQIDVLDDWGGDKTSGMRASGSNSVKVDKQFVPEHHAVVTPTHVGRWPRRMENGTPGTKLHGNPMYLGPRDGARITCRW